MSANGALSGVRVLDLSRLLPGPYCSMILADHGAEVIAIEGRRFRDDGFFVTTVNRNKKHMSLNLKTDEGREIFFRLVEEADVLIEGFRPGIVRKLGVDYGTVRKISPEIIYCSITGYGQTGAARDRAGHDVNYLGYSGVLDLIGEPDRPPSIPGVQIADIAAGGMNAAIGILLALLARDKTGKGQYIDISMTDGMAGLLPVALFLYQRTGKIPGRADGLLSHRYACYNTYETADGRHLSVGALENRFWKRLCEHMKAPEYIPLQYDEGRRREILDFMRRAFRQKTLAEWDAQLSDLDVCYGPVRNLAEVLQDPLLREREMVVEIPGKNGDRATVLGVPVKLSGTPGAVRTPPVEFGESTATLLRRLGYTGEKIKLLSAKGVI
ncbi:carnitine dehydratase [Desulfonema ishimotonii]|uniref:Carnitine dehydratase n=1 Tax=Desulfonema ishimotonii TaxID=45657 RepID=A0A401FTE7_9BACT|nr:CaiB/BaiF CoA-transferase family protein [Desulfonema ishimotonii]GBC60239.1 carnitine dehydratase [Desulfonema ishimotonii]